MCHRFLVPPKVTQSDCCDLCLKGGRVETRKPAGGGAALKLIFRRGGGGRSCSARFIFTLSPSKSPQYPPKGLFSHYCLLQNPHNILPIQSLNMRQPACSPCFPHSSALDLNLVILRHTQKGTIEDGGTAGGNVILSIICKITSYYDIIFMIQCILLNGRSFQGAFSGARGSFQGQKVQGGQQVTST